jgi:hypothetical protein
LTRDVPAEGERGKYLSQQVSENAQVVGAPEELGQRPLTRRRRKS